ncbi:MAG: alpha-N-arabinofuranosidase, partial [Caldilineaceae bacterium]
MTDTQILIDTQRTIAPISPLLFGGFAEHMGRCVYEGMYDPGSPRADARGFRLDVIEALRDQGYTTVRYPGGNFLSGYNWLDGVGPVAQRPRRRELAWQSTETNEFGTNEFIEWCRAVNTQPMLGVNMGTGSIQAAADLVEYCNAPTGTFYADLRAQHGYRDPHNVRYWCVGNEMDGPWQIGHLDAPAYGAKALEAAKMMKWIDPTIETVLCGSSNDRMPTYPEWDRVALEFAWEKVDYLSIHYYAGNRDNDTASYLASAVPFEHYVDTLEGTLRYVKAQRRSNHNV